MTIDPHIFRAYDIRGRAADQITPEAGRVIARTFGEIVRERSGVDHPRIAVGWDARTHGPAIAEAVIAGLTEAGCSVLSIGQTPSPVNYFTVCAQDLDGSIQVTASHNPKEDNGLKLQTRDAEAFSGEDLQMLRARIESDTHHAPRTTHHSVSSIDAITPYLNHLARLFPNAGEGLSIVVDNGNGVTGPVYNEALRFAGATVTELFAKPDGTFPHHSADPSQHATLGWLREKVAEEEAALGLAFDGDGDRVGLVDETGTIRSADEILLLLADDLLERHSGASVVFTVSNSSVLESEIKKRKGFPVLCKVGHSFVEHAMREHGALLGGEQSGHFFCAEGYFGFDDALVAALHILSIVRKKQQPLSRILAQFPRTFQAQERRPHCDDSVKFAIVARITDHFKRQYPVNDLDGARIDFGEGAWAGIRASNTSPKLSICMEARSEEKLREVEEIVLGHVKTYGEIERATLTR